MATDVKTPDFDDLLAAFDIPDMTEGKDAFEHGTDQDAPVEGSRGDNLTPDGGALTTPVKPMPQLQRTRDIVPEIRTDASPDRMPSPLEPIFDLPTNQPEATADALSIQSEQPYHIPTVKPEPESDVPSVAIKKEPVVDSPLDQSHHLPVLKQNQSESLLDELTNQSETGVDSLKSEENSRSASPQEVASTKKVPSIPKMKVDLKPESDIEKTSTKSSSIETASSRIEKLVTSIIRDEEKVKPLPPKSDLKSSETKVSPPELQHVHVTNSLTKAKTSGDSKLKNLLNSEEKTSVLTPPTVKKIAPKPANKPEPSATKAKDQVDDAKSTSTNKPYNTRPRKQNLKFTFEDDCEFEDDFADEPERDKQPAKSVSVGNQNSIAAMQLKELMRQADKDKKESEAASAGQGSIPKVRITTLRTSQGTIMTAQSVPKQSIIPSSTSSSGSVVPIVRTLTSAAMGQLHVAQATAAKTSVVSSPATVQSPGQLSNRVVTQVLTPANNASVRTAPSGTTVHTVTNLGIASILNKPNPVSTYNPNLNVPAKYNFSVPKNGHKCMECGDTFLLYTSLLHHMQRRSIMITINCNICMKSMLFQNKCALLSHSRLHMNRGKKMNLASAIVTPLLKELMNLGQPNPSAPPDVHTSIGQTIVSSASTSTVQRATVQTAVTSSVSSSQTRPSPSLQQLVMGSQPGAMSCTECRIIVNSVSSLEIHFQRNTSDLKSPSLCSLCGVFFPNKCMLWAHQRIHKNLAPYTCPECGKWEKGGRSAFLKHLRTACHHYARAKGYKCTHCAAVYDHVNLLKAHVQSAHAEQFFKCPICPMAFKAIPNIRVHILNTHGNQVAGYRSIYKCPLCDTVFTQTTLLSSHLDTHINDKSNHIVSHFRCLECHKSFDPRETFLQHMQTGHVVDMSDSIVLCDLCKASFPSLIDMESHKKTAHSAYSNLTAHTCTQCHQKFVSAQLLLDHKCVQQEDNNSVNNDRSGKKHQCSLCSYVAKTESNLVKHMKFHEKQGVFSCLECGRQLSSQELLAEHLQTHTKGTATVHNCSECKTSFVKLNLLHAHMAKEHGMPKKYPCTMCNRTFESVHSMKRHVRINHQGIKRVYRCWHCKEKPMSYSKRIMLEKHIVSFHGIASEDIDFTQMPDPKQPVSPDQEASTGNEKRRRNGGQQGGAAKRPKRAKMGFQCAKCEFTTEVKEEFLQHFPQHRLNHTSIQCMECSTSFRSEEALRNHLFVQHEYRDQDELTSVLSEMVAYAEKANSQQDGGVNGLANPHNECSVCFKRFDSDSALKTHMRTHGMAFIRSKRSSSND